MPYWSIYCLDCRGYIADAPLECLPAAKRSVAAYRLLFQAKAGAAIACPYCNSKIQAIKKTLTVSAIGIT